MRYIRIMGEILGEPIMVKCQRSPLVWGRALVAYQLKSEGWSNYRIERVLHRDHSTVVYLRRKVADAFELPGMYRDIIRIWDKFQERIKDDIHEGTD